MKRRFEFRLDRLLRVRGIQEEVARGEWSAAEADARVAETTHRELLQRLANEREGLSARLRAGAGGLAPASILEAHRVLDVQARRIATARTRAAKGRARADALAARWREVDRERRSLVELEERERARHRTALERAEEVEQDERARSGAEDSFPNSSPRPRGSDGAGKLRTRASASGSLLSSEREAPPSVPSSKNSA